MEEIHSCDARNNLCHIDSDEDDHELIQQLISEYGGSLPRAELIRSKHMKSEFQCSSFNDHICKKSKTGGAYFSTDSNKYGFCDDKDLYEGILDSFTELNEFSKSMGMHELTPADHHCLSQLNEKIIQNLEQCRDLTADAENVLREKLQLNRELQSVNQLLNARRPRSDRHLMEVELKKAQKKRGSGCSFTGHSSPSFFSKFGVPYFQTADRFTPGPNADTKQIVRNNEIMLIRLPHFKKFTQHRRRRLEEAVLTQLKTERLRELRALTADKKCTLSRKDDILQEILRVKSIENIQDTKDWKIPINFSTLCLQTTSRFDFRFSNDECERIWQLLGDPRISKADFSEDEMKQLEELTREHGAQDWDRIASLLDTKRSGFLCFVKWARSLNGSRRNQVWTREESERLFNLCRKLEYVEDRAAKTDIWRHIRREFPHRTYSQLMARWMYVLKPDLSKGRFTKKEMNVLQHLKHEGKSYQEISSIIQTRSTVQLRAYYDRTASRAVYNCGTWTSEEEAKLALLVRKHGVGNWKKISEELGTRSRIQCRLKMLNSSTWSSVEKRKFKQLLHRYGNNFEKISAEIGTKSVGQCRYMYRFTSVLRTGRWSQTEIASFRSLVDRWDNDFNLISRKLGTRTVDQCRIMYEKMKKWGKTDRSESNSDPMSSDSNKKVKRTNRSQVPKIGRWNNKELDLFRTLVGKWQCNFHAISREMGTKSADQCHLKYHRLKKSENFESSTPSSWSVKENEIFRKWVREGKRDFDALSREVGTKSADQCRQKYELMMRAGMLPAPRRQSNEPRLDFNASSRESPIGSRNVGPRLRKCEKMSENKLMSLRSQLTTENEEVIVSEVQNESPNTS